MPKVVDHEQRRHDIIDALWQVVSDQGFAAVSVRNVAAQAGLPASTVAQAFDNRTDMLAQALEGLAKESESRRRLLSKKAPTVEQLVDDVMLTLPLSPKRIRQHGVWIALIDAAPTDPAARGALVALNENLADVIRSRLTRAVEAGVLRDDVNVDDQVLLIHAMIDGFSAQLIGTTTPKRAAIRDALGAHFRGLAT